MKIAERISAAKPSPGWGKVWMGADHVDYIPFGEVLLEERGSSWASPYKFNCKELDAESGLYYYGARYYDPRTSVFYGVDLMSDKFPFESPFTYCHGNPVVIKDPDGKAGVAVVNTSSKIITMKAVYYVQSMPSNGYKPTSYSEGQITSMQTSINESLNKNNYTVTEGDYKGYSVKFDLEFIPAGSSISSENMKDCDDIAGYQISNSFSGGDDRTNPSIFTLKDNGDVTQGTYGGVVTGDCNDNLKMNRSFDTKRNRIHEIFHTYFFNRDNASHGIGSYTKDDMPNQEDINILINNPELPKIEEK